MTRGLARAPRNEHAVYACREAPGMLSPGQVGRVSPAAPRRRSLDGPRTMLYHLAAATLAHPSWALLGDLKSGALVQAGVRVARAYGWEWAPAELIAWLGEPREKPLRNTLQAEHARLFVANPAGLSAPPFAGYYLDPQGITGRHAARLLALYWCSGLSVSAAYTNVPDHVVVQCAYLYRLAGRREAARSRPILEDLLLWLPEFHGRVLGAATMPFYPTWSEWLLEMVGRDLETVVSSASR